MTKSSGELNKIDEFLWCESVRTKLIAKVDHYKEVGIKRRVYQRKIKKIKYEVDILTKLKELDPLAGSGVQNHVVSTEVIDDLISFTKSLEITANNIIDAINFIRKIAIFGNNHLGWNVSIPQPAIKLRNYQNPITVDKFANLEGVVTELNAFESYLLKSDFEFLKDKKEFTIEETRLIWGITFYSLVNFSACLDNKILQRFIYGGWKIQRHKFVWVDVHATADPKSRLYRIFPDPISLIFLQIIYKHNLFTKIERNENATTWMNNAISLVRSQLVPSFGGSTNEWKSAMDLWHQIYMPAQLVELAKGHPKTTALTSHAWYRTLLEKPIYQEDEQPIEKEFKADVKMPIAVSSPHNQSNLTPAESYKRLKEILSSQKANFIDEDDSQKKDKRKEECIRKLEELLGQVNHIPNITKAVVKWLLFKLTISESKINISSAYQYLTTFCTYLLTSLGDEDLALIDDESYESIYISMINIVDSDNSKMAKMQLIVQFHRYLMLEFGVTSINFDNLPEFNGDIGAKAHFVSVSEFSKAKELIRKESNPRNTAAYFVMILCFRCGLRIGEAINLLLDDIHYPSMDLLFTDCAITLTVRPNQYHTIKTDNANRQLPLHLMLDSNELLEFKKFVADQVKVKNNKTGLLFHSNLNLNSPLERSEVCRIIVDTLRFVTLDDGITVHQLRHSFCCLIFLLILADSSVTPLPSHWIEGNHPVDINLKSLLLRHTKKSRSPIYQVAEWMGHHSPLMSLSAYMHWGHLPIREYLDLRLKGDIKLNARIKQIICKLLGITNENLKTKLHKKNQNLNDTVASVIDISRLNKTQPYIKKSSLKTYSTNVLLSDFSINHWMIYFKVLSKLHDIDKTESFLGIAPGQTYKAMELLKLFSEHKPRNAGYRLFPKKSEKDKAYAEASIIFNKLQLSIPNQPKGIELSISKAVYVRLEQEFNKKPEFVSGVLSYILKKYSHYDKNIKLENIEISKKVKSLLSTINLPNITITFKDFANQNGRGSSKFIGWVNVNSNRNNGFMYAILMFSLKHNLIE